MTAAPATSEQVHLESTIAGRPLSAGAGPGPCEWNWKVQRAWAERPVAERVAVLSNFRQAMAQQADALTEAVAAEPMRTAADVRVSEVLPLLAACEYLEQDAARVLQPRVLGRSGRPLWLKDVESEVQRVALGRILVIGPSNYPLFLPGVQVLQALAAGNAVTWKPGRGGAAVAELVAAALIKAGLPSELLYVTSESVEAAREAIAAGADKVFFTGSAENGRAVLRQLAETATPSVMELSGCSSVVVLPEAQLDRVAAAITFGMRLNGSATCMAPRRVLVVGHATGRRDALVARLLQEIATIDAVPLEHSVRRHLLDLVNEARLQGAVLHGTVEPDADGRQRPLILTRVTPAMQIAQTDLFAPVLSVIDVADTDGVAAAERACPFALSISIFGEELAARRLAARITMGTVVINDVIVPTADPRVPFGGRRGSGFGVTRGAEGLLEMTAAKTILVRHGSSQRHFEPTNAGHTRLFDGLIQAGHGATWSERWAGLRTMANAAQGLKSKTSAEQEKHDRV